MKIVGIIPARYASTRFPGKPLVIIHGKTMIQRVFEQSKKTVSLSEVYVATDDSRIYDHVKAFGGNVVMTSAQHRTGTERCHEVVMKLLSENVPVDVAINIQGDEPFIHPEQIDLLASCFTNPDVQIATLIKKINHADELSDVNTIKVVINKLNNAIYFSRTAIPYMRDKYHETWINFHTYYKHIGIYAYRTDTLKSITALQPGSLETAESLEQLRWLENGYNIHTLLTEFESHSVDVPGDLLKFDTLAED
jgi:3-deoxy-manno-octulosonate cytidylyltransferase (CMP-KDO synthetase)